MIILRGIGIAHRSGQRYVCALQALLPGVIVAVQAVWDIPMSSYATEIGSQEILEDSVLVSSVFGPPQL